jgi:antitoxin (DNA-binding transcriptional repressor) of toxin-antitoxin stability system
MTLRDGANMQVEVDLQEVGNLTDELLSMVQQGHTIVITRWGMPLAKMVPHQPDPAVTDSDKS